jgi:hypothetical protein
MTTLVSPCPVTWWKISYYHNPQIRKEREVPCAYLNEGDDGTFRISNPCPTTYIPIPLLKLYRNEMSLLCTWIRTMTEMRPTWRLHGLLRDNERGVNLETDESFKVSLFHAPFDLALKPQSTWDTNEIQKLSGKECSNYSLPYWLIIPTRFEREDVI